MFMDMKMFERSLSDSPKLNKYISVSFFKQPMPLLSLSY